MNGIDLSRRDFLFYGGALVAGVTLGEIGRRQLARADDRAAGRHRTGFERMVATVCRECPAGCGMRARLVDAVPVSLQGNPLCPISRGRLCAKGVASLEAYFDPDRLVGPARRVGKRGENHWERVEWSAAVALLASKIKGGTSADRTMLALSADDHGPLTSVWSQFWSTAGARVEFIAPATAARLRPGLTALTGTAADPLFDVEHASYVLSFGAPLAEDWLSPVWAQRSYGAFRRQAARPRGRLVQVDGRRSMTARKADEWLAVSMEQQSSLAYGVAAVLLREDLVNRAFLGRVGGNLPEFERELLRHYEPDVVAAATGVPVITVLRLARKLAASSLPLVIVAADADPTLVDAAMALNALVGAFDRPGGISASPFSTDRAGGAVTPEFQRPAGRFGLVAIRDAGVLRDCSSSPSLGPVLDSADFVVSFSPYLDEAAGVADLLLPVHTPLESWHAVVPPGAIRAEAIALTRPVVPSRLQTVDMVTTLAAVAAAVGSPLAEVGAATASSEAAVNHEIERLWADRRGAPYNTVDETTRQSERGGWSAAAAASREEFGSAVLEAGGWMDPAFESDRILESLGQRGGLSFNLPASPPVASPVAATSGSARGWIEDPTDGDARSSARSFPLRLLAFVPSVVSQLGSPNQPLLFELLGQPDGVPWRVWAEIHPEVAEATGVGEGASVRITSSWGAIQALVRIVPTMPRQTVAVPYVPAFAHAGRWAALMDADLRHLLGNEGSRRTCAVRITRV